MVGVISFSMCLLAWVRVRVRVTLECMRPFEWGPDGFLTLTPPFRAERIKNRWIKGRLLSKRTMRLFLGIPRELLGPRHAGLGLGSGLGSGLGLGFGSRLP